MRKRPKSELVKTEYLVILKSNDFSFHIKIFLILIFLSKQVKSINVFILLKMSSCILKFVNLCYSLRFLIL